MKAQGILINVLIAVVAAMTSHIFWPSSASTDKNSVNSKGLMSAPTAASPNQLPVHAPLSMAAPELRLKFIKAREAVLQANPELAEEEDNLKKQNMALLKREPPATAGDRLKLMEKWKLHAEKIREAIATIDPALAHALTQLDSEQESESRHDALNSSPVANSSFLKKE